MSDPSASRRQPPSPLVFSPETVLAPIVTQAYSQKHGSGSNTVSMPFIKRHVTRRLKNAKQECDKELQRITNAITAFFEDQLREGDVERGRDFREPRRRSDSRAGDPTTDASEPFTFGELRAALQTEDVGSDGGYEAELDTHRHSRPLEDSPGLNRWSSSPGLLSASASSSPSSLRRQNTLPKDKLPLGPSMSSPGPVYADIPKSVVQPIRSSQGIASRRLSRTIHIPPRQTHSAHSSRSTSRSRSPLPRSSHASFAESTVSSSPNRRSSRILIDDPIDPMMTALYDIIAVATDITDTTMNQLTAEPKICSGFVHRVQELGKVWDEHPDWHGRNWFVQVLLAVASLSRVVEWWEAEKQFWNFEDDDEQAEPFTFLLKPADETIPTPTVPSIPGYEAEFLPRRLVDEAEGGLYLPSPSFNQERKPRDEIRKMIGSFPPTPFKPIEQSQLISRTQTATNSARVLAKERLRLQVEKAQSHNIVVELSLDGDRFLWVNYAWSIVVGTDPEDAVGVPISQFLHPSDCDILKSASEQLLADDSHTVEIRFRLRVEPEPNATLMRGTLYQEMEGKGMLMIDSVDAQPTHTMWVIKPVGSPVIVQGAIVKQGADNELSLKSEVEDTEENNNLESVTPLLDSKHISTAVILCRICECNIPEWFFEKHNETCSEVHKFEADIGDCNESITELRNTIRDLRMALDRSSPIENLEYRGVPIFSPATSSTSSSPLHLFRSPLVSRIQRNGIRKTQKRLLEQLDDILQVALEISVPALKEDESREPIERQRLLSPGSDLKIVQVRKWNKPSTEDQGLAHLAADADMLMRTKLDHVSRMQNTIKYSEKVRQEWEEKLEQILIPGDSEDDNGSSNNCEEIGYDDNTPFDSYTAVATPDTITSSEENTQDVPSSTSFNNSKERLGSSHVTPTPISNQNHTTSILSRSSTPSSASSPLARAVPIVASPEPPSALLPSAAVSENYVIKKRSISNIEPRVTITPPLSPSIVPKDSVGFSNRRLSILSTVAPIGGPMSPRIPSVAPSSRSTPTSIKDFEIIKPISKGAFGSVFLAKKKATGDYYAIKVLKKADMIAKNQITNVKAERMILMNQAESPFVAKLYFTFQSKDNLYLVMEYLNGGDCAALIKSLGSLPEDWTRNYIAEVVLGLEYLHQRGIVHRDLKPDNLLIDQHGHLKLTDFGLSRIGLLGRQTREAQSDLLRSRSKYSPGSRPPSMDSAYMSSPLFPNDVISGGSYFNQRMNATSQNVSQPFLSSGPPTDDISESSGSESLSGFFFRRSNKYGESPLQSFANELTNDLRSYSTSGPGTPPSEQKFVGTPDYLAPESILGIAGDDVAVDWWALGVITYEFLYGFPPFHDETPEKVFENILSGHVDWHEDWIDFSSDALDFMKRLLTVDARNRLGANGAQEVKVHPFFSSVDWEKITTAEAAFVPHLSDPESTDYFDPRGASHQLFHDDDLIAVGQSAASPGTDILEQAAGSTTGHVTDRERTVMPADDGFGTFNFKNLPVLKQANDDVIRKLRTDQMVPIVHALSEPANIMRPHRRSVSQRMKKPPHVNTSLDNKPSASNPPSPATSASSVASSPSLASIAPSTPGSSGSHIRKFSEIGVVERFKFNQMDNDVARRNSMPSRLRTASVSTNEDQSSVSDHWPTSSGQHRRFEGIVASTGNTTGSIGEADNRAVTCLLAEDNPITAKIIETLLNRLGCHCIVVADGSEAISVALGDIKFDCILMDLHMPVVDGESAARYIKSTMNKNTSVPIIAISAYSGHDTNVASNLFAASLAKPVQKADLITAMRHLGFKTYHQDGTATKVAPTL